MKKKIIFAAIVSLFLAVVTTSAQIVKSNFAGDWELDVNQSTIPEAAVASMTLKVTQTEKELKIESDTKLKQSETRAGLRRGGKMTIVYSLEDKETTFDVGSGATTGKEVRKATVTADSKLNLTVTQNFDNGIALKSNEIWELLEAGATLKVIRYMETPRGATNAEMYFTNKSSAKTSLTAATEESKVYQGTAITDPNYKPKMISGGVLNGKAISMPKPSYPAEARAARAGGAVNVKVVIDEAGMVISAEAVSGDVLLRDASVEAAKNARFNPTILSGAPVKVTGVIVYNFVP